MPIDDSIYRAIVEQTRDYAVFALDAKGVVATWNRGAERVKGYTAEEIIGRHFSTFYTREDIERDWPNTELDIATAEGRLEDEGWRIRKDGSRFWANVVITALRGDDGELIGFSKITRDLTERKAHDEVLRQSEERFRLLVEGVIDYAIYMLDEGGVITSWNVGAERITGYKREEVLGTHFSRFYLDDDRGTKPWGELALARRTGRAENEGWRVRKTGERFWARVVVTAMHDSEGRLRGFAKVTQDLSERRHAQALEHASQRLNQFIAVLAHELRNPLAPIRNAVHILRHHSPADPLLRRLLETVDRQSSQLVRIVDDMLDMTRISKGLLSLNRELIGLSEVVQHSLETAMPLIQAHAHDVEVEQPPEPIVVFGDVNRLTQLLANLLSNAARYTPDHGHIRIVLERENETAVLKVVDTGQGIAPEAIERMFDMFVRDREAREVAEGGLGIGLALARKIAELHGGTLEGYSEGAGKGSQFVLRLPSIAAHTTRRDDVPSLAPSLPRMYAQRVMIVDDNVDVANTLGELVKAMGHETRVCFDGRDALDAVRDFRPDVVILDIGMPGMSGLDVARQLRADGLTGVRLVAVTGWGQDADRERSREAGFDFHVVKPVRPDDLIAVLRGEEPVQAAS